MWLDFKNGVNSSIKLLRHQKTFYNASNNFCLSFLLLCTIQWLLLLPNELFILVLSNTFRIMFLFFLDKTHKIGSTSNIEDNAFWYNDYLIRNLHSKKLPNIIENNIQIKITFPTNIQFVMPNVNNSLLSIDNYFQIDINTWEMKFNNS
jgi:hypothetical protein